MGIGRKTYNKGKKEEMMAYIIDYSLENIDIIADRLLKDEVGIFPCDTIYGLCARANELNSEKLYEIKNRPQSKSFITLMTEKQLRKTSLSVDEELYERWPAPFTAILADKDGTTYAIRIPSDPFLQKLLDKSGPLYSTSVNFSGEASLLTFDDIYPVFFEKADFIVNHPNLIPGESSTLINATKKPYQIIRQGAYKF